MYLPTIARANFDIDTYINPLVPRNRINRLPRPISRFLGYRDKPRKKIGNIIGWTWSFVGAFCGVALVEGVFMSSKTIRGNRSPIVIGSFGAAAILEYNTIESPLAQPRNLILGHFLSALVGVCITKLFALLPQNRFDDLRWLAGALAVGSSSVVMGVTNTIHPPAGATALLAATAPEIIDLGWYLLPLILLGTVLMLCSACMINNIHRQFPIYWWTPVDLSNELHRKASSAIQRVSQAEKDENYNREFGPLSREKTEEEMHFDREHEIKITAKRILLPDWLQVNDWERNVLEIIRERLKEGANDRVDAETLRGGDSEQMEAASDEGRSEPPV